MGKRKIELPIGPRTKQHEIIIDCNTFEFFVTLYGRFKFVELIQTTDFTGTDLAEDFPDGSVTGWTWEAPKDYTDKTCVNVIGYKVLKDWQDIA